ncbi:hypothetical protein VNO77_07392 [Canavalia gladiata]|uniref:TIR domain-containing protein n=1 Tax=Canavalia gladiata TaxID=3824 RepID=A0AAN9M8C9_CANGL
MFFEIPLEAICQVVKTEGFRVCSNLMAYSSSGASQIKYVAFLCLLLISKLMGVASKQVSEDKFDPQVKYDVFVNFRGVDIRQGFLGYLTQAFHQKQIHAFVDGKLEKGYETWPSLVTAIERSSISLTIFSGNYASSRWCLEELVKILECREKYGQTVIPVFYNVYPTTVRHQNGSYEKAFVELEKKYNLTTVQRWRHALKKAADLSGIASFDYRTEVELFGEIINIVNLVLMKLDKHPLNLEGLIGIDNPIQYLESLLHQKSKAVLVIGIWVQALNSGETHEIFSFYAFDRSYFDMEYYKLSNRVVNYSKGIPLVLKVLGSLLRGKDKEIWESQLNKLKHMPNIDVYNVMRLSYDDLDRKEQQILLDLACFFVGLDLKVDHIKTLLKDSERDNSVLVGLERLKDKALITISKDNVVSMHDIIQETAWEIVRQESIEDPGSRSRLRDPDDIYEVLQNDKGTKAIRSISVHLSLIKKLKLSPHIFTKMSKLQFLYFPSRYNQDGSDLLPHGIQSFSIELRYLAWMHYPLKYLPEKFSTENLVILDLSYSQVEKLWDGVQNLMNLKEVKVSGSKNLTELPDLSRATNLEVLDISFCPQLTSVVPSIFSLRKLKKLDLRACSLTKLTSDNHLSSLSYLKLGSCTKLKEFSVISDNMIELDLSYTRVNSLPSSFERQNKLEVLWLSRSGIESLPSSFKNLMSLRYLSVYDSKELHTLTELPPSLETLEASYCTSLKTVLFPSIDEQLQENRKEVYFWNCLNLDEQSLKAIELNAHINVMKSAYQHLSAPDENYHDYNLSHGLYQVKYVYPGSIVPEWLQYKTTKYDMIIDLSSTSHSSSLGFVFCFVVSYPKFKTVIGHRFTFYITISDYDDESKKDSIDIYMSDSYIWLLSDHVCVIYDQRCSRYLSNRAKNQTRFKLTVKAEAVAVARQRGVGLKGFGVSPIYKAGYHNFMEDIKSIAYHNFIQQINTSADHSAFQQINISTDHSVFQPINTSADHSVFQQINTSADHSVFQQINTSADHSVFQQINTSADHSVFQQINTSADHSVFQQINTSADHSVFQQINTSADHSVFQQINTSADHSVFQQINTSADHSVFQQINTSADHSVFQQINTSADHSVFQPTDTSADRSFFQPMEVSESMYFISVLGAILCISFLWLRYNRLGFQRLLM